MNMLQLIYKLFWTDLLKPFQELLGWKRISKDVRAVGSRYSQEGQYQLIGC
jgi:hypothetical protein